MPFLPISRLQLLLCISKDFFIRICLLGLYLLPGSAATVNHWQVKVRLARFTVKAKHLLAAGSISLAAAADIDHHWQVQLKLARFTDAKADVSCCLNLLQQLMLTIILWAVMGQ